jgi:protein SCO1/2
MRVGASGWVATIVVLAAAAAAAGLHLARPKLPPLQSGTWLASPGLLSEFELVDQRGRPAGPSAFEGRWSLLFLGFTSCPDVCPTTLALLSKVRAGLPPREDVQIVFLSADPERDTPRVLARYLRSFDARALGLTGTPAQVRKLAASLGLGFVRNPGPGGAYTVDHSTALVLLDPQARVAGYFRPPFDAGRLAADLGALPRSER